MKWLEALLHVIMANLVPLWGFTQDSWTPGTTLALYWLQTLIGVPLVAALVFFHRRLTRKAGHYAGKSTFLETFLLMSVPFTLAHGLFLAVLLGLIWKDAAGAVNLEDLRTGAFATLNVMTLGFAFDMWGLGRKPFAWIELRAGSVLQRTLVTHLAIIFGMGLAALSGKDAVALFGVFLALKLAMDLLAEMPTWDPKEPPAWLVRWMNKLGSKDGKQDDFATHWRVEREQRIRNARLAEEPIDALESASR